MDSLSQAALGAAVGVAVMGRTRPVWQAALIGAALGTLPDLDVLLDKGDPVRDMVLHRAETHALFYQWLATPLIAGAIALLTGSRALYWRWCLMVLLVLNTHSLLDAMTIYGTRIGLPFSDYPVGLGSLFIIDPLYTLPLLLGLGLTLWRRTRNRWRWNLAGLAVSTLYAGWSVAAQAYVFEQVMATAQARNLDPDRVLVTPAPLNTLVWRVVMVYEDHYTEGFVSLLDPPLDADTGLRVERFPRGAALESVTQRFASANLIRTFSKGFYALSEDGRVAYITDLRMGQHPYFVFTFAFAERGSTELHAIRPRHIPRRVPVGPTLEWLGQRVRGRDAPPPRS